MNVKIAIGCDEAAFELKNTIRDYCIKKGNDVNDVGVYDTTPVLYPDVAIKVAQEVKDGKADRGILICGTGIGMAITANKVPGIRAAVCHDPYSAERARKSNDAQVLCMGARVIGPELAKMLTDIWLSCEFAGGGSAAKVKRIGEYESSFIHSGDQ
jgi:ribose 5-phosphate isomerase B